jgi:hypothetical protein
MEKHFFTKKNELMLEKMKTGSMKKKELIAGMMAYLVLRTFFSPIGSFILSLLPFVFLWGLYNYFFGFRIWVSISFLIYHIFYFERYKRKKYEEEMLPDYFVIKEAVSILKNRLKHHNYN